MSLSRVITWLFFCVHSVDDVVDESDDNDETEADTENDTENEEDEKDHHTSVILQLAHRGFVWLWLFCVKI